MFRSRWVNLFVAHVHLCESIENKHLLTSSRSCMHVLFSVNGTVQTAVRILPGEPNASLCVHVQRMRVGWIYSSGMIAQSPDSLAKCRALPFHLRRDFMTLCKCQCNSHVTNVAFNVWYIHARFFFCYVKYKWTRWLCICRFMI